MDHVILADKGLHSPKTKDFEKAFKAMMDLTNLQVDLINGGWLLGLYVASGCLIANCDDGANSSEPAAVRWYCVTAMLLRRTTVP